MIDATRAALYRKAARHLAKSDPVLKLILDGAGVQQMPLQTGFLPALRAYGLAPQDAREEELLAEALQRLGLLDRYSDAGEATYVRHVL